jgi:hypothetical protein
MTAPYPLSEVAKHQWDQYNALHDAMLQQKMAQFGLLKPDVLTGQLPQTIAPAGTPIRTDWGDNDLIAQAKFWGIPSTAVAQMSREQLVGAVESMRQEVRPSDREASMVARAIAPVSSFGVGAVTGIMDGIRNLPVLGPAFGRIQSAQKADIWLHSLTEGVRAVTPEVDDFGNAAARVAGNLAAMWFPANAAFKVAGVAGMIPGMLPGTAGVIARGAAQGAGAAWLLEGGSPDWEENKALTLGAGAVLGAGGLLTIRWLEARKAAQTVGARAEKAFVPPSNVMSPSTSPGLGGGGGGGLPASSASPAIIGEYTPEVSGGFPRGPTPPQQGPSPIWADVSPYADDSPYVIQAVLGPAQSAEPTAAGLNKVGIIMESPTLPEIAASPVMNDVTVLNAARAGNPGGSNIIQGVADPVQILQNLDSPYGGASFTRFATRRGQTRLDVLISDTPLTDAHLVQYESFGIYEGQSVVTRNGKVGTVLKMDELGVASVMPENGTVAFRAPAANLQPRVTSTGTLESPELWNAFDTFADQQARAGAQAMTQAGTELTPEMIASTRQQNLGLYLETFLDKAGVREPGLRARITNYFDRRYVDQFRSLAPAESMQAETLAATMEEAASPGISPVGLLDQHASTKGYRVVPDGIGFILEDTVPPVAGAAPASMRFGSMSEAHEFLTTFDRSLPPITPATGGVPLEVVAHLPSIVEQMPNDSYQAAEGLIATVEAMAQPSKAGPLDPMLQSLAASMRLHKDKNTLGIMQSEFRSAFMNWLPMRRVMNSLDNTFYKFGLDFSPVNKVYRPVSEGLTAYEGVRTPWDRRLGDILENVRQKHQHSGLWTQVYLELDPVKRAAMGAAKGLTKAEMAAMDEMQGFWHNIFGETGIQIERELKQYMPMLQKMQSRGDFSASRNWKVSPETETFFEFVRGGEVNARELNPQVLADKYIHAHAWKQTLAEPYKVAVEHVNAIKGEIPELEDATKLMDAWLKKIRYGYVPQDDIALSAAHAMARVLIGPDITRAQTYRLVSSGMSSTYSALLGWNPAAIVRDTQQQWLALPKVGTRLLDVQRRFMTGGSAVRNQMFEDAIEAKLVSPIHHRGEAIGAQAGLDQSAFDLSAVTSQTTRRQRVMGELSTELQDLIPGWMKHEKLRPLYYYGKQSEISRMIVGTAQKELATDALVVYRKQGMTGNIEQLLGDSRVRTYDPATQREFMRLVAQGQDAEAAMYMGRQLADVTQFKYGVGEGMQVMQSLTGKMAGQLSTYPIYIMNWIAETAANGTVADKTRALVHMGMLGGAAALVTKQTGFNVMKMIPFTSFVPTAGPVAELAVGTAQRVGQDVRDLTGQDMGTGGQYGPGWGQIGGQAANLFNPLRGAERMVTGLAGAMDSPRPGVAAARLLLTGERGNQKDWTAAFMPQAQADYMQSLQQLESQTRIGVYGLPTVPQRIPVMPPEMATPQGIAYPQAGGYNPTISQPASPLNGPTVAPRSPLTGSSTPPVTPMPFDPNKPGGGAQY